MYIQNVGEININKQGGAGMKKDERLAFNKLCDDLKLIRWQKLSNSALAQL